MQRAECASCRSIGVLDYHFKRRIMNVINMDVRLEILSHPQKQCDNLLQIVVPKQETIL